MSAISSAAAALANASWAKTENRTARTAPGRAAAEKRFLDLVDPDRVLPEDERAKRAASARKAHFAAIAAKSAEVRTAKAAAKRAAAK